MGAVAGNADEVRAGALILALAGRDAETCRDCGKSLCAHELLFAVVLGRRADPCCCACAAHAQDREAKSLLAELRAHIERRDCYRAAWEWAGAREGVCPLGGETVSGSCEPNANASLADAHAGRNIVPDAEWDAGDMACGELVLELRARMRTMARGRMLLVTAHDPGAPEDLPAWCRMTGYRLVYARPPVYVIRNKEE